LLVDTNEKSKALFRGLALSEIKTQLGLPFAGQWLCVATAGPPTPVDINLHASWSWQSSHDLDLAIRSNALFYFDLFVQAGHATVTGGGGTLSSLRAICHPFDKSIDLIYVGNACVAAFADPQVRVAASICAQGRSRPAPRQHPECAAM